MFVTSVRKKMEKTKFIKLKEKLLDRGYKIYKQQWHHEDYVIGNGFHREDNQWEEDRCAYQILLSVYDYSEKKEYFDRIPESVRNTVSIEIRVAVSRTIEERIDMVFPWHEDTTIEDIENKSENFYQWVLKTSTTPELNPQGRVEAATPT